MVIAEEWQETTEDRPVHLALTSAGGDRRQVASIPSRIHHRDRRRRLPVASGGPRTAQTRQMSNGGNPLTPVRLANSRSKTKDLGQGRVGRSSVCQLAVTNRVKRPGGRPRREDVTPPVVRQLRDQGFSLRRIARHLGAGYGTVRKVLKQAKDQPEVSENSSVEAL